MVLDSKGYLRLTDFGVSKKIYNESDRDTSGTPSYMSPEVLYGLNHSFAADFYSIGVVAYEFCFGKRPYIGKTRKEVREDVMSRQIVINQNDLPKKWDKSFGDLVAQLLQRKPENRFNSIDEIKSHPWFKAVKWKEIMSKTFVAPYIPVGEENYFKKDLEREDYIDVEIEERYERIRNDPSYKDCFAHYTYNNIPKSELGLPARRPLILKKKTSNKSVMPKMFSRPDTTVFSYRMLPATPRRDDFFKYKFILASPSLKGKTISAAQSLQQSLQQSAQKSVQQSVQNSHGPRKKTKSELPLIEKSQSQSYIQKIFKAVKLKVK